MRETGVTNWLSFVRNVQAEMREAGNPNATYVMAMAEAARRRPFRRPDRRQTVPHNSYNIIPGTEDAITLEAIQDGDIMVNFHGERNMGRYYKKNTYNSLSNPKRNPYTRRNIGKNNVVTYKAKVGGSRRRTLRNHRRR
jgi:hypothetical protein